MKIKEKIILFGAGQQLNVVLYNLYEQKKYIPVGIADINQNLWGKEIEGIPVLHDYKDYDKYWLDNIRKKYNTNKFFISLGSMKLRISLYKFLVDNNWEPVNIIHPDAIISKNAKIGKGVLIECGCLITPNPVIGNNVVINTGSQVNHDNIINDNVYIASGVILSGGVIIDENTLLDDGVIITLGRKIGKNCIIGAGSVVTKDIPDNKIAYGNPCRVIRDNDKY
ncbi:MAG: acetyltransferase [Spirochaetes bacterium]|nr:acetyltransferase [Spirochaetota bacterium]